MASPQIDPGVELSDVNKEIVTTQRRMMNPAVGNAEATQLKTRMVELEASAATLRKAVKSGNTKSPKPPSPPGVPSHGRVAPQESPPPTEQQPVMISDEAAASAGKNASIDETSKSQERELTQMSKELSAIQLRLMKTAGAADRKILWVQIEEICESAKVLRLVTGGEDRDEKFQKRIKQLLQMTQELQGSMKHAIMEDRKLEELEREKEEERVRQEEEQRLAAIPIPLLPLADADVETEKRMVKQKQKELHNMEIEFLQMPRKARKAKMKEMETANNEVTNAIAQFAKVSHRSSRLSSHRVPELDDDEAAEVQRKADTKVELKRVQKDLQQVQREIMKSEGDEIQLILLRQKAETLEARSSKLRKNLKRDLTPEKRPNKNEDNEVKPKQPTSVDPVKTIQTLNAADEAAAKAAEQDQLRLKASEMRHVGQELAYVQREMMESPDMDEIQKMILLQRSAQLEKESNTLRHGVKETKKELVSPAEKAEMQKRKDEMLKLGKELAYLQKQIMERKDDEMGIQVLMERAAKLEAQSKQGRMSMKKAKAEVNAANINGVIDSAESDALKKKLEVQQIGKELAYVQRQMLNTANMDELQKMVLSKRATELEKESNKIRKRVKTEKRTEKRKKSKEPVKETVKESKLNIHQNHTNGYVCDICHKKQDAMDAVRKAALEQSTREREERDMARSLLDLEAEKARLQRVAEADAETAKMLGRKERERRERDSAEQLRKEMAVIEDEEYRRKREKKLKDEADRMKIAAQEEANAALQAVKLKEAVDQKLKAKAYQNREEQLAREKERIRALKHVDQEDESELRKAEAKRERQKEEEMKAQQKAAAARDAERRKKNLEDQKAREQLKRDEKRAEARAKEAADQKAKLRAKEKRDQDREQSKWEKQMQREKEARMKQNELEKQNKKKAKDKKIKADEKRLDLIQSLQVRIPPKYPRSPSPPKGQVLSPREKAMHSPRAVTIEAHLTELNDELFELQNALLSAKTSQEKVVVKKQCEEVDTAIVQMRMRHESMITHLETRPGEWPEVTDEDLRLVHENYVNRKRRIVERSHINSNEGQTTTVATPSSKHVRTPPRRNSLVQSRRNSQDSDYGE